MFRCDLTFGLPQSTSRDLRRERFRQFPVATRFDTIWAIRSRWPQAASGPLTWTCPRRRRPRGSPLKVGTRKLAPAGTGRRSCSPVHGPGRANRGDGPDLLGRARFLRGMRRIPGRRCRRRLSRTASPSGPAQVTRCGLSRVRSQGSPRRGSPSVSTSANGVSRFYALAMPCAEGSTEPRCTVGPVWAFARRVSWW